MKKISCIIPAYNEGPRIKNVLNAIYNHPLVHEVVVVDDGSVDTTADVVKTFAGVRLISQKNAGKSKAIVKGILESSGDILFFLDADLIGITDKNITDLILPVLEGNADISISLRDYPIWNFIGIDPLSGERVLSKSLLEGEIENIAKLPSFALETFINKLLISKHSRIKIVSWKNVKSPFKSMKSGFWSGIKQDFGMIRDILRIASVFEIVSQIYHLHALKVKTQV